METKHKCFSALPPDMRSREINYQFQPAHPCLKKFYILEVFRKVGDFVPLSRSDIAWNFLYGTI